MIITFKITSNNNTMEQIKRKIDKPHHIIIEVAPYSLPTFAFIACYFCSNKRKRLKRDDVIQWKLKEEISKTNDNNNNNNIDNHKRLYSTNSISIYWRPINEDDTYHVNNNKNIVSITSHHEQITKTTLESIHWACNQTSFYGKRRGRIFNEYVESKLKPEILDFMEQINQNKYSWENTVLPPTFYELQARLRKRDYVASTNGMCMADVLVFTYISVFLSKASMIDKLKIRLIEETPHLVRWYGKMHVYLKSILYPNEVNDDKNASNIDDDIMKNYCKTNGYDTNDPILDDSRIQWLVHNNNNNNNSSSKSSSSDNNTGVNYADMLKVKCESKTFRGVRSRPTGKKRTQKVKRNEKQIVSVPEDDHSNNKNPHVVHDNNTTTNNIIKNPLLLSRIVSKIRSNTKQNDDKCKNSKNNYLDFILQTSNKNMKRTELIEVTSKKWNRVIPRKLNPVHYKMGQLKEERKLKKQQQVTNMIAWVNHLLSLPDNNTYNSVKTNGEKDTMESKKKKRKVRDNNDNIIAIDFCCGSGHVGLALAAMRRDITVILIDCNPISIALAQSRAAEANVTNVKFLTMDIRDFKVQEYPGIRIGFALHACGPATDYALQKCLEANASYVFAPCCVGFIQNESDYARKLPCSRFFRDTCQIQRDEFLLLSRIADHTSILSEQGSQAMLLVNEDRNCLAKENGYITNHTTMLPATCTPKNDIIFGTIQGCD